MTQTDAPTVDNGVNIEALRGRQAGAHRRPRGRAVQVAGAAASGCKGTHSRTTITDFSGLGAEHAHRQAFTLDADHPEVFASEDNGATPPEIVLAALGRVPHRRRRDRRDEPGRAAALGEGDRRRPAWTSRASSASTATSATASTGSRSPTTSTPTRRRADLEAIVAQSQKRSAVFDIITNPTTVRVELA